MVDLSGHEAGNGGYSQRKPTAHRDSSTRKLVIWPDYNSYAESRELGLVRRCQYIEVLVEIRLRNVSGQQIEVLEATRRTGSTG
jgi:hypothetical protein